MGEGSALTCGDMTEERAHASGHSADEGPRPTHQALVRHAEEVTDPLTEVAH